MSKWAGLRLSHPSKKHQREYFIVISGSKMRTRGKKEHVPPDNWWTCPCFVDQMTIVRELVHRREKKRPPTKSLDTKILGSQAVSIIHKVQGLTNCSKRNHPQLSLASFVGKPCTKIWCFQWFPAMSTSLCFQEANGFQLHRRLRFDWQHPWRAREHPWGNFKMLEERWF